MTTSTTMPSSSLSAPSPSLSDSTQFPPLEIPAPEHILEPDCETNQRWWLWGYIMTNPSYALALDAHFAEQEDDTVLNLITIYRATDFTTPYADHLVKALFGNSQEAAASVAYQQRKIKNIVLQTFEHMKLEEDFRAVERKVRCPSSPVLRYPSIPTIATITHAHNHPEATNEEWLTWFRTRESTVEPTSSISTISSLNGEPKPLEPVEKFIPAAPTPSPPPLIVPTPTCKVEETLPAVPAKSETPPPIRQRNRRTKKRQEVLASFGLPLTQVYPPGEGPLTVETAREVAHVVFAEKRRVHPYNVDDNFICRKCKRLGHRHIHCPDYLCRYCWKYSPGHFTCYCPSLRGKRVLRIRSSHQDFHAELAKLESILDRRDEVIDTQLYYDIANLDVDPVIYNDARLDDC